MKSKMNTKVATRLLLGSLLLMVPVIMFQNCAGYDPATSSAMLSNKSAVAISSTDGTLRVVQDPSSLLPGAPFTVIADLSKFPSDDQFLWDHDFGDGLTYCALTTSLDKTTTSFSCPGSGQVSVNLTAYASDGSTQTVSLAVNLGNGPSVTIPGATPTPVVSTPTPTPTPVGLSSDAMLYNTTCSGCHGTLPNLTDKKGTTLAQLNNAIANVGAMAFLATTLSATDKNNIISALNSP